MRLGVLFYFKNSFAATAIDPLLEFHGLVLELELDVASGSRTTLFGTKGENGYALLP